MSSHPSAGDPKKLTVSRPDGSLHLPGRELGHHIEFDIYVVSGFALSEVGNLNGGRNQHDFDCGPVRLIGYRIDCQADAVNADRSLGNHKATHGFFQMDSKDPPQVVLFDQENPSLAINMTGYEMATKAVANLECAFEIDG